MVAGSRSSLRRPTLRADPNLSRSSSPVNGDRQQDSPPSHALRNRKRVQTTSTISIQEPIRKRRRLSSIRDAQKLRIPLRGKLVAQPVIHTRPSIVPPDDLLKSPTFKPQYDQIRIIEDKARAAIRGGSSQPGGQDDSKRKLRSEHGGTRIKTELSQYFANFEEMLSLEPKDPNALTAKTVVTLIDDTPLFRPSPGKPNPFEAKRQLPSIRIVDLSTYAGASSLQTTDPLSEDSFMKIHKKAERHEKQMKNGDRERAQHEKYQLERLLEELKGPDWLKTLGISGITDSEKKRYEPKRKLFIRETQALINKFKWWKEEEKRRKREREEALAEELACDEILEIAESPAIEETPSPAAKAPDSSEIDALASQQLIEEAKSASRRKKPVLMPVEVVPPKPFTSFFEKRHLRDAAVSGRQRGRLVMAFGLPVPELEEVEFELPEDILTEDAIRQSDRRRRRVRRGSGGNGQKD